MATRKKPRVAAAATDDAHLDRVVEPEYASISTKAVVALVLAVAGVLAFLPVPVPLPGGIRYQLPILMVVPLVAGGLALAAMREIRHSEGTRVGLSLAKIALVVAALVLAGSGIYHFLRQHRQVTLQEGLVAQADRELGRVLSDDYRGLYAELATNNPKFAETFSPEEVKARLRPYLYEKGEYFGKKLEQAEMITPSDAPPGTLVGRTVYKLSFSDYQLYVQFQFQHVDDDWKLMAFQAQEPVPEKTVAGEPKRRFE